MKYEVVVIYYVFEGQIFFGNLMKIKINDNIYILYKIFEGYDFLLVIFFVQVVLSGVENLKVDVKKIEEILKSDKFIINVVMVYCEILIGVIYLVVEVGKFVKEYVLGVLFFVDVMSSFGVVSFNLDFANVDFMVSFANKCIEGVFGFLFVIGYIDFLKRCKGWVRSFLFDIVDQYEGLEKNGQFRFILVIYVMFVF